MARFSCLSSVFLRAYPDPSYRSLRSALAGVHGLDADFFLPGNGAAELITWAARDAAAQGSSTIPSPGFADYTRALRCWSAAFTTYQLPLEWSSPGPSPFKPLAMSATSSQGCIWITNPHNPTGVLWDRSSLLPLLTRFALVIVDEAFLPLVPDGEAHSLIHDVPLHPNLVVLRSLTKLYGSAGLRVGYAVAQPERLQRWSSWRDPWPVNGPAAHIAQSFLADRLGYQQHCAAVQSWTQREGHWLGNQLSVLPGLRVMPSSANFLLLRSKGSEPWTTLTPLREALQRRHRILLRDCSSFASLGPAWLRLGFQRRTGNRRLVRALRQEVRRTLGDGASDIGFSGATASMSTSQEL